VFGYKPYPGDTLDDLDPQQIASLRAYMVVKDHDEGEG